jgi:hypothetical protein
MTDVFYGYMTDLQQVLDSGQAMDITQYATKDNIPTWDSVDPALKAVFTDSGKIYAIPTKNYSMGLLYNKTLFTKAGLDVNNPPKTWADVRAAAKKIAALGGGVAGTPTTAPATPAAGTSPPSSTRRAARSSAPTARRPTSTTPGQAGPAEPQGHAVRRQQHGQPPAAAVGRPADQRRAGKVGMFVGAPDATTAIVQQFQGKYQDWAMAPMPGQDGAAKGTLGGGEGYFFRKDLSPDQVKAGLKWIAFEKLTPGKGQFDYARAKPQNQPVGLPQPLLFSQRHRRRRSRSSTLRKANQNVPSRELRALRGHPGSRSRVSRPTRRRSTRCSTARCPGF